MHLISNRKLQDFAARHPLAAEPLQAWRRGVESADCGNFAEIKSLFSASDKVGNYYVFNIGGNKYRVIAAIHFNRRRVFIRAVLTHKEYDAWKP